MSRRLRAIASVVSAVLLLGGASLGAAQPAPNPPPPPAPSVPADLIPPDETAPVVQAPAPSAPTATPEAPKPEHKPATAATAAAKPPETPPPPPEPPKPVRSAAAVMQALDKVTAQTIRFAVPIGKRIRYKSLIFTVKACETTGIDDPQPKASAYVIIEAQPAEAPGGRTPPIKQVFKGWMFSTAPGLHPLQHPVYDAWLIACSATVPAT